MQTATFRGRRGVQFVRALPARVPGWRLVLDKPAMLSLPETYANLCEAAGAETFGVAYEITAADLSHVDLTEGVLIGNYERIAVPVVTLGPPFVALRAFTLVSAHRAPEPRPTTRYMSCLVDGAREHGLPASWIATLERVAAADESPEATALRPFLDEALGRRV
jgi:AIG2 family protein